MGTKNGSFPMADFAALAMIGMSVALMSCTSEDRQGLITGAPAAGQVVMLPAIEWRVVTERQMRQAYEQAGKEVPPGGKLHGFAAVAGGRHVIYTLPPKRVDDQQVTTLGHEVLHVALGAYHQ